MPTPSSYRQFQQVDASGAIVGGGSSSGGGSSATSDALLTDIKAQLVQVYSAIDGLELITGNIKIDAGTMNLSVDGLESGIAGLDATAIAADLKLGLINAKLTDIRGFVDGLEGLLTSLSTSSSNIDTSLVAIELRSRPLIPAGQELWGAGDGEYVAAADVSRRAVKIINNTGEANGRNAATLFIAYNGNTPDRVNHSQFIKPGEFGFLDCPNLDFRIVAEGVAGLEGSYIVARFE